ncbi:RNA-guided endonuclease TnpB family protein [Streptomyces sp. B-S-A8]|uniref:RNA-guided endonuclease TnpB family protein n=1 Tax=Streptomyces solicavernae TaxID=3043614 RepID=A0ABT6RNR4_9ACTN|nr:RNA-guided endonuclease TnpB family protein [Streptomyces sp. B-S-A8]MDI3386073.1 RNA-guided endonuclease TnpB family protein [Streptomyces sp. B-S-A8]
MRTQQVKRAFRYRFHPTEEQAAELSRTFGCVRRVYNMALQTRREAWAVRGERVTCQETSALLTAWKKTEEYAYLRAVSSVPLQQSLRHLQAAFSAFFSGHSRHPRFKSRKRSKRSAEYTASGFRYCDGRLRLAKMSEPLDIVWSRPLPPGVSPTTVTVTQDRSGRWFVSLLMTDEVAALPPVASAVGVDAGIHSLVALSSGEKVPNPRFGKNAQARLARAQRSVSRKQPGSRNHDKARAKAARIHARIADRRNDFLHKLSTRLVRENQTIVIEDLAVRNMLRNPRLAGAISDASWGRLRFMLTYKSHWYGRELIVIDRFCPTSKTCSHCGHLVADLPLRIRNWVCPACGAHHDRDVNAARTTLAAGLAVSACGADVGPERRLSGRAVGVEAGKPGRSAGRRRGVRASPPAGTSDAN